MTRPYRALCMAALLAVATLAQAEIDRPAAESLERKSGLWEQFSGVAAQIEAGLQQAMAQGDGEPAESEKARISRVIRSAYAPDRLRSVSAGVIASKMQPQHLEALRRWFDSPQGQAVARAEEEATPDTQADAGAAMKDGLRLLASMPLERRKLLQDLLTATHAAEGLLQITISTTVAVQLGAASAMGVSAPSASQVRAALEAQRPQMLKGFIRMTLASFAQVYAKLPTEQLRAYVAFIRSPAGTAFNEVSLQALDAALTDAASEMGRSLPGTRDGSNT